MPYKILLSYIYSNWSTCLTYSMEQSTSWEAIQFSATQETPHILWNPKVHYHVYKSPQPVPFLSQINPVRASPSHFLKIHIATHKHSCAHSLACSNDSCSKSSIWCCFSLRTSYFPLSLLHCIYRQPFITSANPKHLPALLRMTNDAT